MRDKKKMGFIRIITPLFVNKVTGYNRNAYKEAVRSGGYPLHSIMDVSIGIKLLEV